MMDKSKLSSVTRTLATEPASFATMRVSSHPVMTLLVSASKILLDALFVQIVI